MQTRSKYNNAPTTYYGITFDSKKEGERYLFLKSEELAGRIKSLAMQVPFTLLEKGQNEFGTKYRELTYIADFTYYTSKFDHLVVEDVKGFRTEVYKIKKKLFLSKYPHIEFKEL